MINQRFGARSKAEGEIMHKNYEEAVSHKSSDFLSKKWLRWGALHLSFHLSGMVGQVRLCACRSIHGVVFLLVLQLVGLRGPAGKGMKIGPQTQCAQAHPVTSRYWSRITEACYLHTVEGLHTTISSSRRALIGSCKHSDVLRPLPPALFCNKTLFCFIPSIWAREHGHFSLSGPCLRKHDNGKVCWFQQYRDLNIIPPRHCYCGSLVTLLNKVIHKNVIILFFYSEVWQQILGSTGENIGIGTEKSSQQWF